ncbi:pentapeptide repeat-containing protein [Maridesulfovibrio frigidus]|uniref:pentapeptide repeat-containing protein n=1 Tax=Maridesulfovibrio frigidus TaxID=340956 RepID=UPI000A50E917|nr:pentapeptide repeat-containing protein [Maridesulfovibrio frigidus]
MDILTDSDRIIETDKKINEDLANIDLANKLFLRLVVKGKTFKEVDFKYCIFDSSYLRNCNFDSCNFTGCRFINSNFNGSTFEGCSFDYSYFDKTIITSEILDVCCPAYDNLKSSFARTLRKNYQSLGEVQSVNKAIKIELESTKVHLRKSCLSKESYYRRKYKGFARLKSFMSYVNFISLDFIWGNGESTYKLCRAVGLVFVSIAFFNFIYHTESKLVSELWESVEVAPQIFLGTFSPKSYSSVSLTVIKFVRLVMFGFFMSIILKRFNKR